MNDSSSRSADDEILGQIMCELDQPDGGSRKLDDYLRRHPNLASQIRELFQARELLDRSRPTPDIEQPKQLGPFKIIRLITKGGMGDVYEAEQDQPRRRVVVKVIRQGRTSPESRERFLREQEMLARLHHTNIVPIHAAGEEGSLQYFAMPYIDGAALHHVVTTALQWKSSQPGSKTPSLAKLAKETQIAERSPAAPTGPDASTHPVTTSGPLPSAEARSSRLTLSQDYFRSVAEVMADAAEALHHAHAQDPSIVHRDLKPSNIMVDKDGQCWIIDFGLAGYLNGHDGAAALGEQLTAGIEPATASGIMGTPQYMAPEQFDGKADSRTDVWGLGVTLYELLTLQRAFDGPDAKALGDQIQKQEPPALRELVSNVPTDLAAICQKAMQKGVGQRYQSANALAGDLRRWMHMEAVSVRRLLWLRLWLWARRNKGLAAALFVAVLAILAMGAALIHAANVRAEAAEGERKAAVEERAKADERTQERQADLWFMQLQQIRLGTHRDGWFKDVEEKARQIAKIRKDTILRDQYAATLAGLDAKPLPGLKIEASSVAFSKDGKRLAVGGSPGPQGKGAQPARVWNMGIDDPKVSTQKGSGPVAFRANDAVHLVVDEKDAFTVRLWNIDKNELVREFKLAEKPSPPKWYEENSLTLALSADGSLVAASTVNRMDGKGTLLVWDVKEAKPIQSESKGFSALAFSQDGTLLAAGTREGTVTLRSVKAGKELATLSIGRTAILCLTFAQDPLRKAKDKVEDGWLLATGDAGSAVTIWDLRTKQRRATCRGSSHNVNAVAFSPDSTILASTGRLETKLWDAGTGQLLLNLKGNPDRNWLTGLALSPDGKKLAVSSTTMFGTPGGVDVWELEEGRGLRTLRGLLNRVAQVAISPDDRFLAALDDEWHVAIWDLTQGRLHHVFEVPLGYYTDNAGLAFSPNGDRFAFATKTTAKLWDIATGKEIDSWSLQPGLNDKLAFDPTGKKLLLVRVETEKGELPPVGNVSWKDHPRVVRAYDLLSPARTKPFVEIKDFKPHVWVHAVAPDGEYFVVEGIADAANPREHLVKVLDGASGKRELIPTIKMDVPLPHQHAAPAMDPTGKLLTFQIASRREWTNILFEMPSGKRIRILPVPAGPSADMKLWNAAPKFSIYRDPDKSSLVTLDFDSTASSGAAFTFKGTHLTWGNRDGTVTVGDLGEVLRRLAAQGLGW